MPFARATRARRRAARLALPALACAASLASAGCSYRVVRGAEVDESAARAVEQGISEVRGLRFRTPVPIEVKTTDELRSYLEAELAREYAPEELAGIGRVYELLGLLPEGVDVGTALLRLYTTQVAGFYDPRTERLYLVPSGVPSPGLGVELMQLLMRRDLVNEMLLAHELVHALQDQNFDTLGFADDHEDDDRALAVRAVLEGDATLAGFAHLFGGLDSASVTTLVDGLGAVPAQLSAMLPDTPPVLRETLVFQYSAGARFVAEAYLAAGWPGVDALLRHPPLSTEQVLRPEKYFDPDARDDPVRVRLGGLDDHRRGGEWRLLEENTLGELAVRVLVEGFFGAERAERVAAGWDGDRFAAFARGDDVALYWMTVWDGESDARDFFAAEREILERSRPGAKPSVGPDRAAADGARPWSVERRGERVLVVIGLSGDDRAEREAAVWERTTVGPAPIHRDLDLARER